MIETIVACVLLYLVGMFFFQIWESYDNKRIEQQWRLTALEQETHILRQELRNENKARVAAERELRQLKGEPEPDPEIARVLGESPDTGQSIVILRFPNGSLVLSDGEEQEFLAAVGETVRTWPAQEILGDTRPLEMSLRQAVEILRKRIKRSKRSG